MFKTWLERCKCIFALGSFGCVEIWLLLSRKESSKIVLCLAVVHPGVQHQAPRGISVDEDRVSVKGSLPGKEMVVQTPWY